MLLDDYKKIKPDDFELSRRLAKSIFVFGSNKEGRHGKGAALEAKNNYGAVYGVGSGLTGRAYAIPTKITPYTITPLEEIKEYVQEFKKFAATHHQLDFKITRLGCTLAGYTDDQIGPLFADAPPNCFLPGKWLKYRDDNTLRLIINGSRASCMLNADKSADALDKGAYEQISKVIERAISNSKKVEIVCGGAVGGDFVGHVFAKEHGIPIEYFPANWNPNGTYDKAAGFKRNVDLVWYGNALISLTYGDTNGTKHTIELAEKDGLRTKVIDATKLQYTGEALELDEKKFSSKKPVFVDTRTLPALKQACWGYGLETVIQAEEVFALYQRNVRFLDFTEMNGDENKTIEAIGESMPDDFDSNNYVNGRRGDIWSIGHSNLDMETFLQNLKTNKINAIADIRSSPFSKLQWFNKDKLAETLKKEGIYYVHIPELGGRSEFISPAGHVDYTKTAMSAGFQEGVLRLLNGSKRFRIATMCSEQDPATCHRGLMVGRCMLDNNIMTHHILKDGSILTQRQLEIDLLDGLVKKQSGFEPIPKEDIVYNDNGLLDYAYSRAEAKYAYKVDVSRPSIQAQDCVENDAANDAPSP